MNDKARAFTLVEILIAVIVIAILAGLIAFAIGPTEDRAKAAACSGNMRTLKSAYVVAKTDDTSNAFGTAIEKALHDFKRASLVSSGDSTAVYSGVCPDNGAYIIMADGNGGSIKINCTKHIETYDEAAANIIMASIPNLPKVKEYFKNRKTAGTTLDSTGPNFGPDVTKELGALLKTDLSHQSFTICRPTKDIDVFDIYYTVDGSDISTGKKGDTYTVYKYSTATNSSEKGTIKIKSSSTNNTLGVKVYYNVFDVNTYAKSE